MTDFKWIGTLSTTEPFNHVGLIKVRRGNKETETFETQVVENNKRKDLSLYSAFFHTIIDGQPIELNATVVPNQVGKVRFVLTEAAMQQLGTFDAYICFKIGEEVVGTTQNFKYTVIESASTVKFDTRPYWQSIEDLINEMNEFISTGQGDFTEWFETVKDMLYGIDPGGNIVKELVDARVDTKSVRHPDLASRLSKDFLDRLNKEELIKFLSGEKLEIKFSADFKNKTAANTVTNPNIVKYGLPPSLAVPNVTALTEFNETLYRNIDTLNNVTANVSNTVDTRISQALITWNIYELVVRKFPELAGISNDVLKTMISGFKFSVWARGIGPAGNKVTVSVWFPSGNAWQGSLGNASVSIAEIAYNQLGNQYLTSDGNVHLLVHSPASDGITASTVYTDYTSMEVTLKIGASMLLATEKDFQIHVNNKNNPHNTTANQVGAYTKSEADLLLTAHKDDKNNPHNVNPSQLGVYTKKESDNLLATKREKSVVLTMADMGQDVKSAMTGGSVAVVGPNAFGTVNVMNRAITGVKLARNAVHGSVFSYGPVNYDTKTKKLTFYQLSNVLTNGQEWVTVAGGTVLDVASEGFIFVTEAGTLFMHQSIASNPNSTVIGGYLNGDNFFLYGKHTIDWGDRDLKYLASVTDTVMCLGDSLTAAYKSTNPSKYSYPSILSEKLNTPFINKGATGSTWAEGGVVTDSFIKRAKLIDFSVSGTVLLFGGHNDFEQGLPIGTLSDNVETTMLGAINKTLQKIYLDNPVANVLMVAPSFRAVISSGGTPNYIDIETVPNKNGVYFREYVAAIVSIAYKYKLPLLNLYEDFNVNTLNYRTWLSDGLHFTDDGYTKLAKRIGQFVSSN